MAGRARAGWLTVLLVVPFTLALAGCPSDPPPPPPPPTPSPEVPDPPGPDRAEKVRNDADGLITLLNNFWSNELSSVYNVAFDAPDRVMYYESTDWDPCGLSAADMTNNAFYCSVDGDEKVEYDLDWLSDYLIDHPGGATTFLILAHEWGHAVQDTWVENNGADVWVPQSRKELNADCLAGVFIARSIDDGTILEEDGDADAIFEWLFESGSTDGWLNPGDHGTPEQRQAAFSDGVVNGTDSCRQNY